MKKSMIFKHIIYKYVLHTLIKTKLTKIQYMCAEIILPSMNKDHA